ncbi:MAG: carbonic anhydrase [Verrucomicrobiales bacterium]|jgi:carbonic anhydrase
MKSKSLLILFAAFGAVICLFAADNKHADWSYDGETGPEFWGDLDPAYALCRDGVEQSPINLIANSRRTNQPLEIHWGASGLNLVNNGHTVQQNYDEGSFVNFGGVRYNLLQFHFHRRSEHTIHGDHSAMEAHFVHASEDGQLLVVGVMLDRSIRANPFLKSFWDQLPTENGEIVVNPGLTISAAAILPENLDEVYHYAGSLTTPPGSEGVKWFIFREPVKVSGSQIARFSKMFPNNFRPIQELNDREVTLLRATRD